MPPSSMPFLFLPILLYIIIVFLLFYLINKFITGYISNKQEQNEILKDLVKTVDKALEKRNSAP